MSLLLCQIFLWSTVAALPLKEFNESCLTPHFDERKPIELLHQDCFTSVVCPIRADLDANYFWTDLTGGNQRYDDQRTILITTGVTRDLVLSCKVETPCGTEESPPIKIYYLPSGKIKTTITNSTGRLLVFSPAVPVRVLPNFEWKIKMIFPAYDVVIPDSYSEISNKIFFRVLTYDIAHRVFYYLTPLGSVEFHIVEEARKMFRLNDVYSAYTDGDTLLLQPGSSQTLKPCFFSGRYVDSLYGVGNRSLSERYFTLNNVTLADERDDYWCSPVSRMASIDVEVKRRNTLSFSIRVYEPIVVPEGAARANITEGEVAILSCLPQSGFPRPSVTWFVNAERFNSSRHPHVSPYDYNLEVDWQAGSLSIKCQLSNKYEDLTVSGYVVVLPPLVPLLYPSELSSVARSPFTLYCSVKNPPFRKATATWLINGENVPPGYMVLENRPGNGDIPAKLIISLLDNPEVSVACIAEDGFRKVTVRDRIFYRPNGSSVSHMRTDFVTWIPLGLLIMIIPVLIGCILYSRINGKHYNMSANPIYFYAYIRKMFQSKSTAHRHNSRDEEADSEVPQKSNVLVAHRTADSSDTICAISY